MRRCNGVMVVRERSENCEGCEAGKVNFRSASVRTVGIFRTYEGNNHVPSRWGYYSYKFKIFLARVVVSGTDCVQSCNV